MDKMVEKELMSKKRTRKERVTQTQQPAQSFPETLHRAIGQNFIQGLNAYLFTKGIKITFGEEYNKYSLFNTEMVRCKNCGELHSADIGGASSVELICKLQKERKE